MMNDLNDWIPDLRSALAHLHDPAFLENHPLAEHLGIAPATDGLGRAAELKRILRLGIEALDAGPGVEPTRPEARPYQILRRYYISKQSMMQIGAQLGISERHCFTELKRALRGLERVLQQYAARVASQDGSTDHGTPSAQVKEEVERLSVAAQRPVDLVELVQVCTSRVRRLASARGIALFVDTADISANPTINRTMLRQALLNLVSHAITVSRTAQPVHVRLQQDGQIAILSVAYCAGAPTDRSPGEPYTVALELLDSMAVPLEEESLAGDMTVLYLRIPLAAHRTIVVADDNEGMITLYRRYLRQRPFTVLGATSGGQALRLIEERKPDAVILDVMMPDQDGWDILETIRSREDTAKLRVIVCSIINDPWLASVMGADAFLHKPVDARRLVQVLDELFSSTK